MAIIKKKTLATSVASAPPVKAPLKSSGGRSVSPAPSVEDDVDDGGAAAPGSKSKVSTKAAPEAAPNVELVALFVGYDEKVSEAEGIFVQLVELIQEQQLDRATVVASMMQARGINFESAQSQYSRMKKIFNNEEVLQELKDGKINLKVARERTTDKQKNPKSAKPEAKEQKYQSTLKSFVAAAKESGFARREIMVGVEAELKSAGIK